MNEINTMITGMSTAVPQAISMQVSAHSTGLMHINSALNQQRDSMLGISNYVMGVKKMNPGKLKYRELGTFKKGRF
ncbi:MAG: RebB family R body protein [Chryseobacterium sp.]|uniref:RebB family R body protein n=1 Tax=Chryseobacterium sp. TaxID=1871047 RepID=UPI0025BC0AA1|nr:RebB family R body protein [Chryseobacterium sp.]MCJ7932671.1 RebB family R body protein [Chryseobacterium sp.]